MQLARVVFAGALLFGFGCELPEEGDLATDERVDQDSLDDSVDYATEGLDDAIETTDYAIDDTMAWSGDISEDMAGDAESMSVLEEDDTGTLGNGKKWKCCYCAEDDNGKDEVKGDGKEDCYCAKDKKKKKAKKKAKDKCEDKHDDCEFDECKKDH